MKSLLSPREVARAIGVSESSLKRWVDEGRITASRTAGGHRRIEVGEAVRFIRDNRLAIERPEILGFPGISRSDRPGDPPDPDALYEALVERRGDAAESMILASFLGGAPIALIGDGPVRAALSRIGELWRDGPDGIAAEHYAVDICVRALVTAAHSLPTPPLDAPLAVGGAFPGDPYVLPSLLVSFVLTELGFRRINLGPSLPAEALLAVCNQDRPDLVWWSSSLTEDSAVVASRLNGMVDALPTGTQLVVGGRGLAPAQVPQRSGLQHFGSLAELVGFTRRGLSVAAGLDMAG